MNLHDRETIVTRLNAEITKTKAAIAQYAQLSKPIAPENAIGRVSRMDAINNKSINDRGLLPMFWALSGLAYRYS